MTEFNYRGYRVIWNGSATFNVFVGQNNIDCFTSYVNNPSEAHDAVNGWIDDQIEAGNYDLVH